MLVTNILALARSLGGPLVLRLSFGWMLVGIIAVMSLAICEPARTPNATHMMMYPLDSASRSITAFGLNGSASTVVVNSGRSIAELELLEIDVDEQKWRRDSSWN